MDTTHKLQEMIDEGRRTAPVVLQEVQNSQPKDYLVGTPFINFNHEEGKVKFDTRRVLGSPEVEHSFNLHPHALNQCTDFVGIPRKFTDDLFQSGWGRDLLAHNMNTMYGHIPKPSKRLVRVVNDEVRGYLSDRYRRIDTPLCINSFIEAIQKYGAVPIKAKATEVKFHMSAALPQIVEPYPGEPMVAGIAMSNSDYGKGAFEIRFQFYRLLCKNGMMGSDCLRKIHLGARISDDIALSEETHRLDNAAVASATKDIVDQALAPAAVKEKLDFIKTAHEKKIDFGVVMKDLKSGLTKNEAERIGEVYRNGGVEQLPVGDTAWRFANAISWLAGQDEVDTHRSIELEAMAGKVAGIA